MVKCLKCGREFIPARRNQRFDTAACRVAWNNDRKLTGIHLEPFVMVQLQEIADAHSVGVDQMANLMLHKMLNPDGRPLTDDQVFSQ